MHCLQKKLCMSLILTSTPGLSAVLTVELRTTKRYAELLPHTYGILASHTKNFKWKFR